MNTTQIQDVKYTIINELGNLNFQFDKNTDIIPGVYEGGFTLWECTVDFLKYMETIDLKNKSVLDVGCGLGLLGIKALKQGAKNVMFQDYNKETFEMIIKPQLQINSISNNHDFIYGDWIQLSDTTDQYDIALASELIYREENYDKLILFLLKALKPLGRCYMINKAYYFGVGGSVEGFKEILLKFNQLQIVDEIIINNKKSNKKVILVIERTIH